MGLSTDDKDNYEDSLDSEYGPESEKEAEEDVLGDDKVFV